MKKGYSFHTDELETVLIYNRADDCWVCSTNIPGHMAKLEKRGWQLTEDLGYERGYKAPKNAVTFRNIQISRPTLSEDQRKDIGEKLKQARTKIQ